jgi:hypothetical protein
MSSRAHPARPAAALAAALAAVGLAIPLAGVAFAETPVSAADPAHPSSSPRIYGGGDDEAPIVRGLGLMAINHGRPVDLRDPSQWSAASGEGRQDTEVGWGWRNDRVTALVGYIQPDQIRDPDFPALEDQRRPRPLVGLSFALRYP